LGGVDVIVTDPVAFGRHAVIAEEARFKLKENDDAGVVVPDAVVTPIARVTAHATATTGRRRRRTRVEVRCRRI
jgi:hypothetical protein